MSISEAKKIKNIVVIGGGTGTFAVLSALKQYPVDLTAVVSMADDGGSTGILRDQYGVLPPGDARRALVALSPSPVLRDLFNYRFANGDLEGHSFGNLFLSALEKIHGNFALAVSEAGRVLNIKGTVLPVTLDNVRLVARLANGKLIRGETNIDISRERARAAISHLWLEPKAMLNPAASEALQKADLIIIGPGDLYTSIIPNLLVAGMSEDLRQSKAKKVYVCNVMTKYGETHGYKAEDFVCAIERYLGNGILDYALFNKTRPARAILAQYKKKRAELVALPRAMRTKKPKYIIADLLDGGNLVRHSSDKKFAKILLSLV